MTPVQIAYFKHFLFDMGINKMYTYRYRHFRIKGGPDGDSSGNPESIEQFFLEKPYTDVIMKAFYFEMNSQYGHDFWKDVNNKWLTYWGIYENNAGNLNYINLRQSFSILRQNWDKPSYWKSDCLESPEETYKRMGIEPPLPIESTNELCKFNVGDIIQGTISGETITVTAVKSDGYETNDGGFIEFDKEQYWDKIDEVALEDDVKLVEFTDTPEPEEQKSESDSILDGFSLVETTNPYGGRRIGTNIVSVNLRNNGYRITFSAKQSNKLYKHGYKYVKLLTKKDTGEIALIFNNQQGCNVCVRRSGNSESSSISINSKEIVSHITKFYAIKPSVDYFTLKITDTIQHNLDIIYKLRLTD